MTAAAWMLPAATAAADQFAKQCEVVGFSTHFDEDETVFCAANEYEPVTGFPTGNLIVRKSVDAGATWDDLPAVGLQGLGMAFPSQLIVSPEYPADATIYVHVVYGSRPGIYRSTDDGTTFANVAPLATTGYHGRALTPFLMPSEAPPPVGSGREAFAYATASEPRPAVVFPPLHQPVVGAPGVTRTFLLSSDFPSGPAYAVSGSSAPGSDPTAAEALFSVYSCDASLSCLTKVYDFPAGWTLDDARMLPSGLPYFVMSDQSNPKVLKVWRMDTGGGVHEWSSLNDRLPDIGDVPGLFPRISVTEAGPTSRWSYARFSYVPSSFEEGPPTDQVFASADDGTTWRRMSYGRHVSQPGRPKGIPWQLRAGPPHAEGDIHAPSDDTLVIVARLLRGDGSSYEGVFCSFDRGRKWYEGCRRP